MGEYDFYQTACGKRSVQCKATWNVPDNTGGTATKEAFPPNCNGGEDP